jgi:arginine utilization regulatory protein
MNQQDYELLLNSIIEVIDEGVQVVSRDGRTLFYNSAMARMEETARDEVLGKKFSEAFSQIPETESTLHRALMENKATQNIQQTYLNKYGKEITTVNTTFPIELDGRVVAAVEIAKDITHFKIMSDTLLELQEESIKPLKMEHPRIRHYNFADIIGENAAFRDIIHIAKKAAKTKASVFIYGETGTGKELIAQSIHYDGDRKNGPFLAQNCAALPESLLESILFGTAKGGSPVPWTGQGCLSKPMAERFCWMKSARCLMNSKANCSGSFKKITSDGLAGRKMFRWMCGSLPRSTRILSN